VRAVVRRVLLWGLLIALGLGLDGVEQAVEVLSVEDEAHALL